MDALRVVIACAIFVGFPLQLAANANNFEAKKAQYLERLDLQLQELDKAKTCASGSQNMGELRKCRQANKMAMKELKAKLKDKYGKKKTDDENKATNTADDSISDNADDDLNEK